MNNGAGQMKTKSNATHPEDSDVKRQNTIVIPKDLILYKDTEFKGNLEVHGSIVCKDGRKHDLIVIGDLAARDIVLANLNVSGNIRARSLNVYDLQGNNLSVVRKAIGTSFSITNASAEDFIAHEILAKGDISASNVYSSTSISATDLLVTGYVDATDDIRIRNAETGGIITQGDIYYDMICHARYEMKYRHIYPRHKNSRHFISKRNINIKGEIFTEKRD